MSSWNARCNEAESSESSLFISEGSGDDDSSEICALVSNGFASLKVQCFVQFLMH